MVGSHAPCLTVGEYGCSMGEDLFNLLVDRHVDLILSGHEHSYQRTVQLKHNAVCPIIRAGEYDERCVSDDASDGLALDGAAHGLAPHGPWLAGIWSAGGQGLGPHGLALPAPGAAHGFGPHGPSPGGGWSAHGFGPHGPCPAGTCPSGGHGTGPHALWANTS